MAALSVITSRPASGDDRRTPARAFACADPIALVRQGTHGGGLNEVQHGRAVVALTVVFLNAGTLPLTLTQIRVEGPGAGFVADPPGGPSTYLPAALRPGEFTDVRFGLTSDCSVAVRPEPRITLLLHEANGRVHEEAARIPDLDSIWGQTLAPDACHSPQ